MSIGKIFKNSKSLIAIIIALVVVLALAVTVLLVLNGRQETPNPQGTEPSTQATTEGTEATDPTDTTGPVETKPTEPEPTEPKPTEPEPTEPEPTEPKPTEPKPTEPKPTQPTVYTVTFKDWDGKVLKTEQVEKGKGATAPANPTREHYNFAGWDKTFSSVTSDLIVTAKYTTDKLIISAESVTVNKGTGEVTMNIRVVNNPGIMGAVLKVSVNDEVLGVSGANKVGFPGLTLTAPGSAATSSPYTFMLDSLELSADDKKDGTLFTITFKIKDTSVTGKYDVKLSCNQGGIFDENYNDLNVTFVNGSITIK